MPRKEWKEKSERGTKNWSHEHMLKRTALFLVYIIVLTLRLVAMNDVIDQK